VQQAALSILDAKHCGKEHCPFCDKLSALDQSENMIAYSAIDHFRKGRLKVHTCMSDNIDCLNNMSKKRLQTLLNVCVNHSTGNALFSDFQKIRIFRKSFFFGMHLVTSLFIRNSGSWIQVYTVFRRYPQGLRGFR
jgi:hypothetical protein